MSSFIQVQTTVASQADAQRIANTLVEQRLAACVQIVGPIESVYRWQGQIESSAEWLCVAKTRRSLFSQVEAAVRAVHSYEVPEIIATELVAVSASYAEWLAASLAD